MGFEKELVESGHIHRPLPVHKEESMEQHISQKAVAESKILWKDGQGLRYRTTEQGRVSEIVEGQATHIMVRAPLQCECWPEHMPQDGDCAYYGRMNLAFYPDSRDWRGYNRLRVRIKPECEGVRVVTLSLYLINDGEEKVPDFYKREGFHLCECENHQWNDCIWEFPSLPRDSVTMFGVQYRLSGRDTSCGEEARFLISTCTLERVWKEEMEEGWKLPEGVVAGNTLGYGSGEKKISILNTGDSDFWVEDSQGNEVFRGVLQKKEWKEEEYGIADFSELKEGRFRIHSGSACGEWFSVKDNIWEEVIYKGLNFLFCERCGYPVPKKHGLCHMDTYAKHDGVCIPYCGGWHDAGDMSQQTIQTAETVESLLELAAAVKTKTGLYQRIMEEALWGLEFVLRTRFQDGYRATSLGLIRYTDGKLGNEDDAANVRVHNHALENFICAGVEALAAESLKESDPELSWRCVRVAKEDFAFAMERYQTFGMELPIRWEHTYDSSLTLMYAEICLAASRIYSLTGEEYYGDVAADYGNLLAECQETREDSTGMSGFFYRDEHKTRLLHYCHQSREHVPVAAWRTLCRTQTNHPDKEVWEQGIALYGQYIKGLFDCASPYGMLPAGIYSLREAKDRELFSLHHIQADYEQEKENYRKQVTQGTFLKGDLYIRQFPVWFSFRGNMAHMFSMGKATAIVGNWKGDSELLDIAAAQKDWLFGVNPFCRSLMYGVGKGWEALYCVFPGICVGQVPVGVQTKNNSDIPYWPLANNSTYKEVWVTSLVKLFGIISEIIQNQN